nr:hypothetical protein [Lysobacter enzymogenes]
MSERRDPPKPGSSKPAAPLDGEARPTAGRLRKLDSLDAARAVPSGRRRAGT